MRNRGPLRLVKREDPSAAGLELDEGQNDKRLSIGWSLVVWGIMGALAWAVVAVVLRLL